MLLGRCCRLIGGRALDAEAREDVMSALYQELAEQPA
jgi:hypothetical protein